METVVNRVHQESWRDGRTGGEGWGSSAGRHKLLFEDSTCQSAYMHKSIPSLFNLGSGFGAVGTLLMPRTITHAKLCYYISSCPLHSLVTS